MLAQYCPCVKPKRQAPAGRECAGWHPEGESFAGPHPKTKPSRESGTGRRASSSHTHIVSKALVIWTGSLSGRQGSDGSHRHDPKKAGLLASIIGVDRRGLGLRGERRVVPENVSGNGSSRCWIGLQLDQDSRGRISRQVGSIEALGCFALCGREWRSRRIGQPATTTVSSNVLSGGTPSSKVRW